METAQVASAGSIWQVDQLTVKVYASRQALGRAAAHDMADRLRQLLQTQHTVTIVFAAAPSQNEFLDALSQTKGVDWARVIALHMDEYLGLPEDAPQRFSSYLRQHLFDRVQPGHVYYLNGNADDALAECQRYASLLREHPVDIVCAGIGENGHLAFNDPGVADFLDPEWVKVVPLDAACRQQQVNDGCFASLDQVPTHALTLTIPALMAARWIYCVVPGPTKAAAVALALSGRVRPELPASILRIHPRATLYLDQESAAGSKG